MSNNIKKNLSMLIALHCSSKAQRKELIKNLKPDTVKAICECTIDIIDRNIKGSHQEKRKVNRYGDKIRELVNPKTSQKKRKVIFLNPLLAPVLGSLVVSILKCITGE